MALKHTAKRCVVFEENLKTRHHVASYSWLPACGYEYTVYILVCLLMYVVKLRHHTKIRDGDVSYFTSLLRNFVALRIFTRTCVAVLRWVSYMTNGLVT